MHMVISKRKNTHKSIYTDDQAVIVKKTIVIWPDPIWHVVKVIGIEVFSITINPQKHLKIVQWMRPKSIVHVFAVVKILKGICILTYRIILGINQKQNKPHQHPYCKRKLKTAYWKRRILEKTKLRNGPKQSKQKKQRKQNLHDGHRGKNKAFEVRISLKCQNYEPNCDKVSYFSSWHHSWHRVKK